MHARTRTPNTRDVVYHTTLYYDMPYYAILIHRVGEGRNKGTVKGHERNDGGTIKSQ